MAKELDTLTKERGFDPLVPENWYKLTTEDLEAKQVRRERGGRERWMREGQRDRKWFDSLGQRKSPILISTN